MKSIIYTEWLKVKSYRMFWLVVGVMLLVIPAANFICAEIVMDKLNMVTKMAGNPFSFPEVWKNMAVLNSFCSQLPGFLLIILVTNEYSFRTNRQNIIDGWERREFVMAKLFWIALLALFTFLQSTISASVIGLKYGDNSFSFSGIEYILYYILQLVVMLTIALVIAIYTQRAGLGIILFFAYIFIVDQLFTFLTKKYVGAEIGGLFPLQAGDELLPVPFEKAIVNSDRYPSYVYILFMLGYIALGIWLVFRKLLKKDL